MPSRAKIHSYNRSKLADPFNIRDPYRVDECLKRDWRKKELRPIDFTYIILAVKQEKNTPGLGLH